MRTTVHYETTRKGLRFKAKPTETTLTETAHWHTITVGLWQDITAPNKDGHFPGQSEVEWRTWRVVLKGSTLFKDFEGQTHDEDTGYLTEDALEHLGDQLPPVMNRLIAPVLRTTALEDKEEVQIRKECHLLWVGQGAHLQDPHPLLAEAVTAMSMHERYGTPLYKDLRNIPQRVFCALRLASSCYGDAQATNQEMDRLQTQAAREAGIRH